MCHHDFCKQEEETKIIYCDCCLGKQIPAIKTCLKCEVSLCNEHIKDHLELPVFTGHPLVSPLRDLLERKCPKHEDQVLRYYCNASRRYVCNVCALESKQHNQATEASTALRRQLTVSFKRTRSNLVSMKMRLIGFAKEDTSDSSGSL